MFYGVVRYSVVWKANVLARRGEGMTTMNDCERLVAIELLGRPHGRERDRMYHTLRAHSRETIDAAINSLETTGVLRVAGARVVASDSMQHLERLSLLAI